MKKYKTLVLGLLAICLLSCVQKTHAKKVTFKVNMKALEEVETVEIKGEFPPSPWKEALPLSDEDGDGIFEITLTDETAQKGIEFKFMKNGEYELDGHPNRTLQFDYKPETIIYEAIYNVKEADVKRN